MKNRASGILLHITSLPSPYGVGDLGEGAYQFADFLHKAGQHYWQILPLNPADPALCNSPYSSCSAFAGNTLLISPSLLVREGYLDAKALLKTPSFPEEKVDYDGAIAFKNAILEKSFAFYQKKILKDNQFKNFCEENKAWLENFSSFIAFKKHFNGLPWHTWPKDLRDREKDAFVHYEKKLGKEILKEKFFQFLFFKQWQELKSYCNKLKIDIIGDIPFYVQHDSVDVWANIEFFKLDEGGSPEFVSGVPPDYFSETGQLWGNPVYRWDVLRKDRYGWWKKRLGHNLKMFDIVRIDHFRGFVAYWEVPQGEKTAINGKWAEVPTKDFFDELLKTFKDFSVIAEDLGIITDDVKAIMKKYRFPGMKVLHFAFDSKDDNPYLPPNHVENCVVYTGTHDNNTTKGWFRREATEGMKEQLARYLTQPPLEQSIHWQLISMALQSKARTAIFPLQDALGLDETARMNTPSTMQGNWQWRVLSSQLDTGLEKKLSDLSRAHRR